MYPSHNIVIRHALDEDVKTLAGLAVLDSRAELTGPALLAEVDGVPRAALDLHDGSVAADPFHRTVRARRAAAPARPRPRRRRGHERPLALAREGPRSRPAERTLLNATPGGRASVRTASRTATHARAVC